MQRMTPEEKLIRWRFYRRIRREVYSPRWIIFMGLVAAGAVGLTVFWVGQGSVLQQTTVTLTILSGLLFVVMVMGFYRGVRIRKDALGIGRNKASDSIKLNDLSGYDVSDVGELGNSVEDPRGFVISILVALGLLLLLPILVFLLTAVVDVVIPTMIVGAYYVLSRSLRQIMLRSHRTRGKLAQSLISALGFTFAYTSWFWALLAIIRFLR